MSNLTQKDVSLRPTHKNNRLNAELNLNERKYKVSETKKKHQVKRTKEHESKRISEKWIWNNESEDLAFISRMDLGYRL